MFIKTVFIIVNTVIRFINAVLRFISIIKVKTPVGVNNCLGGLECSSSENVTKFDRIY